MSGSRQGAHSGQHYSQGGQDADLSLESTSSQTLRGLRALGSTRSGYNPYDSVPAGKGNSSTGTSTDGTSATGMHRLDEMRRLSEWIRTQRELERERNNKKK